MKILLPDSETKVKGGIYNPVSLSVKTELLLNKISEVSLDYLPKLYGVKGSALDLAISINSLVKTAKTLPAIQRFQGVVFDGLDFQTLKNKEFAKKHLFIMTSLFGLVNSQDHIPNYKLSITKLQAHKIHFTSIDDFVIDLLPLSHKKAVSYENGVRIEFIVMKNGKKIPAGHNGKYIKGRFCRFIIENSYTQVVDFLTFNEEGFVGKQISESLIEFEKRVE